MIQSWETLTKLHVSSISFHIHRLLLLLLHVRAALKHLE